MKRTLLLAALLAASPAVRAHYLWLEAHPAGPRLYFGEYEDGVRERSGGRLDEIPGPVARTIDGQDVPLVRRADYFGADPQAGGLVAEEGGYPVKDWSAHGVGVVKPRYYARLSPDFRPAPPRLALDIVPAGPGRVAVWFRGAPLAEARIDVHAPNGWSRELRTDKQGQATIETPWPGRYVLEVVHREAGRGEFGGKSFDAVRHRATLTVEEVNRGR